MKFRIGDWTADPSANQLMRNGDVRRVEARAMDVLALLHSRGSDVVSKEELIETVWQRDAISDQSVAVVISSLRRALGDSVRKPRYIETIPKRGYRLICNHAEPGGSQGAAPGSGTSAPGRRILFAIIGLVIFIALAMGFVMARKQAVPETMRFIVVDTVNATTDQDHDALASALAAVTLDLLSSLKNYQIIRWRAVPPVEFAEYPFGGAAWVLTSTLVASERDQQLAIQLTNPKTNEMVWSATAQVSSRYFLEVQRKAIDQLYVELGETMSDAGTGAHTQGEQMYWRARHLWGLGVADTALQAQSILLQAIKADPDYARPHALLADMYAHNPALFSPNLNIPALAQTKIHLARARQSDPENVEADIAEAHLALYGEGDVRRAAGLLNSVVEKTPGNAQAWLSYATVLGANGTHDEAVTAILNAEKLDPLSSSLSWDKAWVMYLARRYDDALEAARTAEGFGLPVELYLALIFTAKGDHAAAIDAWIRRSERMNYPLSAPENARALVRAGQHMQAYGRVLAALQSAEGQRENPVLMAVLLMLSDDHEQAKKLLGSTMSTDNQWASLWVPQMPVFDPLNLALPDQ